MLGPTALAALIKIAIVVGVVMGLAAYLVLVERWIAAWVQMRRGPNRVGIPLTRWKLFGLGQPIADGMKFFFKEEFDPAQVNRRLYLLAPFVLMTAALAVYACIPLGSTMPINASKIPLVNQLPLESWGWDQPTQVDLMIAPQLDVGLVYIFALSSLAVYGVILGGWASNSKYSFLGGLRSSAQMIAYELPLGLAVLGVALATGSLRVDSVIGAQAESGLWFAFTQPLGMVVFVVAAFAEAARLPFDLPEAEQELVGGYHTEYSGMKLMLFLTAEFIHMITGAFLIVMLFFGGWHIWGMTAPGGEIGLGEAILRIVVLLAKMLAVVLFFMLVRWSWPRFRYDQLMTLGWKVMLPLGVVNLVAVAIFEELRHTRDLSTLVLVATGWTVAILAWLAVAWASPLMTDNRPRLD